MKLTIYEVLNKFIPEKLDGSVYGSGSVIDGILNYTIIERYHTINLKSKKYNILELNLPDIAYDVKTIAKVNKVYGKYVAVLLTDKLSFEKILWMQERLGDFNKYPDGLLNLITVDEQLAKFGEFHLDIVRLESEIKSLFPNIIFSTSMNEMVYFLFKKEGVEMIEKLL